MSPTSQSMPKKTPQIPRAIEITSTDTPRGRADRLFRNASECVRQRERYARLVAVGAHDDEQGTALRVACLCDEILLQSVKDYEKAASATPGSKGDEWVHKANALWHASREYERRHHDCDQRSRQFGANHTPAKFSELTMQYDLEASALLALRLAVASYSSCCPDAELRERPQTYVA